MSYELDNFNCGTFEQSFFFDVQRLKELIMVRVLNSMKYVLSHPTDFV